MDIERARRDARLLGHAIHAGTSKPTSAKAASRCFEDALTRLLFLFVPGHQATPPSKVREGNCS